MIIYARDRKAGSDICNNSLIFDIKNKGPSTVPWNSPKHTLTKSLFKL